MSDQAARIIAYTNIIEYANSKIQEHLIGSSSEETLISGYCLDIDRQVDTIRHLTSHLQPLDNEPESESQH